jgi:DNA helicase-2/ATP-dependent DNA helicase PcrA
MIASDDALLRDLTQEQREAVLHRDGPLLIVAGAGSGKTRVVTRRIARLMATGVPGSAILAITFTNKAAGEMRERVVALLPGTPRDALPAVSTFHSFAARFLREHAPLLGWGRDFSILDPDDQLALVRECAVAARVDIERFRPPLLAHAIGRAKEKLDDEAFVSAARPGLEQAAACVLPIYRLRARERNVLDFDDLVASTVRILEGHSDVRADLLERVRYVLVDEYQDTNHAQYRLAKVLAGERRNLAVCGDPDQSIYGWRGADMGNILHFEDDYPETRVIRLERNYRSTATILEVSNALIGKNSRRKEKQLVPTGARGVPVEVARCYDEDDEAAYVARRVEEVLQSGTPAGEVAVVYRANALSRRYEEALLKRGVAFTTVGSVSFFERREVKDALAYVRLAANPADDLAALRALKTPPRGLGERTFDKLSTFQRDHGVSLVAACGRAHEVPGLSPHARAALGEFSGLARDLAAEASSSVERLVKTALARTKLEEHVLSTDARGQERVESLRALVEAAREAGSRDARGFLDRLALLDQNDSDSDTRERVNLTTIHAAKGLEFDVVFVVGLEEGLFPHERAVEEGGIEEERRLAYVAFTRARQRLVLTWASFRGGRASSERRFPSTFLHELPRELLWDPEKNAPCVLPERSAPPPRRAPARETRAAEKPTAPLWNRGLATPGGVRPAAPPAAPVTAAAARPEPLWRRTLTH